ncbi:something about silencing protein 10-like [Clavelina lepadiformis]|uniref:something about silencing protein 10-like n=1 Tax=Clavelina lepadiformis TaxID=159417 RepID=UPI0040420BD9
MVKKSKNASKRRKISSGLDEAIDEDAALDPELEDFYQDEVDRFHADLDASHEDHSSDEELADEEEVLGIDDVSSDDVSDDASESDGIPSSQAWGKKQSTFYGAERLDGLEGVDRDAVEDAEEEEALKIQQRLVEEMDEDQLDFFQLEAAESEDQSMTQQAEKVVVDVSQLSSKAQWKLLKQDSPEIQDLINDFKSKAREVKEQIHPLVKLVADGRIHGKAAIFIETKFNLYSSYLINVSFYLAMKAKMQNMKRHPVIKRMLQYRTLINKLATVEERFENEIEATLEDPGRTDNSDENDESSVEEDPLSPLKLRPTLDKDSTNVESQKHSRVTLSERLAMMESASRDPPDDSFDQKPDDEEDVERRAIDYAMSKNKGAQAKKRKVDRNPRVKHREKYRKAKIRRKGQVRSYKPEMNKYSGEASGIRAGVVRGVRIR